MCVATLLGHKSVLYSLVWSTTAAPMGPLYSSSDETVVFSIWERLRTCTCVRSNVFALMLHDNQVESELSIVFLLLSFFVASSNNVIDRRKLGVR